MYPRIHELETLWGLFKFNADKIPDVIGFPHFDEVEKLMTAESVIDIDGHAIYSHAAFVHELTEKLINLRNTHPSDRDIEECCRHWLSLLRVRNIMPLKLRHHQKLDGECDFRFSLQLMEGRPCGFKEIQVLDHNNKEEVQKAVSSMSRLDRLAHGISFSGLPGVKDTILSSLMEYKDVICLLAKDRSDQIIGHCWAILVRDVEVGPNEKANIYWVMNLTRDPDFYDANIRVGDEIRNKMCDILVARNDCDFVGYQHIMNHKFHARVMEDVHDDAELFHLKDEKHPATTSIRYDDDLNLFMRTHFIRVNDRNCPYPSFEKIKLAIVSAFWKAAHTARDFVFGALSFFGTVTYQKVTHQLLDEPVEERIYDAVSSEQQDCDMKLLKQIILRDEWRQQGLGFFGERHVPTTVGKLQSLIGSEQFSFDAMKSCVAERGTCITRRSLASHLYGVISVADSATFVLNSLLRSNQTPREWIGLINQGRDEVGLRIKPAA